MKRVIAVILTMVLILSTIMAMPMSASAKSIASVKTINKSVYTDSSKSCGVILKYQKVYLPSTKQTYKDINSKILKTAEYKSFHKFVSDRNELLSNCEKSSQGNYYVKYYSKIKNCSHKIVSFVTSSEIFLGGIRGQSESYRNHSYSTKTGKEVTLYSMAKKSQRKAIQKKLRKVIKKMVSSDPTLSSIPLPLIYTLKPQNGETFNDVKLSNMNFIIEKNYVYLVVGWTQYGREKFVYKKTKIKVNSKGVLDASAYGIK